MNSLPHPGATRLQNFVATMRRHGNTSDSVNLETLARFNTWTSADELLTEFKIQENGSRKLPEEQAVTTPSIEQDEEPEG